MDVWQLAIIGGAAFLAVRALVTMASQHGDRFRKQRKRELRAEHRAERELLVAERAAAAEATPPADKTDSPQRQTKAAASP